MTSAETSLDPLEALAAWREEARQSGALEPDAMVLATATLQGVSSARVVLCRAIDARGLCFHTNYESRKGQELASNAHAAAVFFWPSLGKQVRLEGRVAKLSPDESDAYFARRPRGHQLQAWASPQSQPIPDLEALKARHAELDALYAGKDVPRPPYWGGYRFVPEAIELWRNGEARLHTRELFRREGTSWRRQLLAP